VKKELFAVLVILAAAGGYAQEMRLSVGNDFAIGAYRINNDFWTSAIETLGPYAVFNETTNALYFAPGVSFAVRFFSGTDAAVSKGVVFRTAALVMAAVREKRATRINGSPPETASETRTIADDVFVIVIDAGAGPSYRFKITDRTRFYTDLGLNLTVMGSEDYSGSAKHNYIGVAVFSGLAFQFDFTRRFFLELGLNSKITVFSGRKGTYAIGDARIGYEDSGRWDMFQAAAYLHAGWRVDARNAGK